MSAFFDPKDRYIENLEAHAESELARLRGELAGKQARIEELHDLCGAERLALDCRIHDQRCRLGQIEDENTHLRAELEWTLAEKHEAQAQAEREKNIADGLRAELDEARRERDEAREDAAGLQATADLRWKSDMRAIKRWQAAHPGNDLVWPDHTDLSVWLMEQLDSARKGGRDAA